MDTSANPDLTKGKGLATLLAEQKIELAKRTAAVEEYRETQIRDDLWQGFWSMYRPRVGGFRDIYIQQISPAGESNSTSTTTQEHITTKKATAAAVATGKAGGGVIHGVWREGGATYMLKGSLSPSQRMVEGATVHKLVPSRLVETIEEGTAARYQKCLLDEDNKKHHTALDKEFISPMSMKIGAGYQSIRANFDWRFLTVGGTDHCVLNRQHPSLILVYTTDMGGIRPTGLNESSAHGDRSDIPSLASTAQLPGNGSTIEISQQEEEDGLTPAELNEMGEVRTRKILKTRLAPVQAVSSAVAHLDEENYSVAPVTSSSDLNTSAFRVVLKSQIKRWLEAEDLAVHWCEGGLYSNDEYACVTKDDIERICFEENKFCILPTTFRGVAQVRQQKLHALIVHIDILPCNNPAQQVTPAQQASEDLAVIAAAGHDVSPEADVQKRNQQKSSEDEERLVAEIESEAPGVNQVSIGLIDSFVSPPQEVDGYLTLQGTFTSVETASSALHEYLSERKPKLQ